MGANHPIFTENKFMILYIFADPVRTLAHNESAK